MGVGTASLEISRHRNDTEVRNWAERSGNEMSVHFDRERVLDETDFPAVSLTEKQLQTLGNIQLVHVVLDHDKPDLAMVQTDLVGTWGCCLGNISLLYATNGSARLPTDDVETIIRPTLTGWLGVPDLVAESTDLLISRQTPSKDVWFSFASADAWVMHPQRFLAHLADAQIDKKQLITSFCGGIGRKGTAFFPDYYFSSPNVLKNTWPGIGLMTEFFAIRADLASRTLINWNNPDMGRLCYKTFHEDPRLGPFLRASCGTVETHFRYLMATALADLPEFPVVQMNPQPKDLTKYPRAYPNGIGYTSTHNDSVRVRNIEIAIEYDPYLKEIPSLRNWYEKRTN